MPLLDDIRVHRVPIKAVVSAIRVPSVNALLTKGLAAAGETDLRRTIADLLTDYSQLWVAFGSGEPTPLAVWVTGLRQDNCGARWLCVHALAGRKMHRWAAPMSETMVQFAAKNGCVCVRWAGKRGWQRAIPNARIVGKAGDQAIFERAA